VKWRALGHFEGCSDRYIQLENIRAAAGWSSLDRRARSGPRFIPWEPRLHSAQVHLAVRLHPGQRYPLPKWRGKSGW